MSVDLAFRPGVVTFDTNADDRTNLFEGDVLTAAFLGETVDYSIEIGLMRITAELEPDTIVPAGGAVQIRIPARHVHVFAAQAGSETGQI
ncbi:hypothetical protein D9M68_939990 [compost metagenome]